MTQSPAVTYARVGDVGVIQMHRASNRNGMTAELLDGFVAAITAAQDDSPRCVIVTGSGNVFSAGADFRAMTQRDLGPGRLAHERSFAMYEPFLHVLDLNMPVIAAINGHCIGGGFGLALLCDMRVGVAKAKYGANFTQLGLHPGMGTTLTLPTIAGRARGTAMLLSGELIDGVAAHRDGILLDVVDDALAGAHNVAARIAAAAPIAVRLTKQTLRETTGLTRETIRAAAQREALLQAETLTTADAAEGVSALLEKRAANFCGR